ncbi:MAG TPA: C2H2-type zinc finger protein [Thermoplasmata archaeon]|nr:C2H2-type zinc finger protein [Thermoplasmata archaeon]
MAEVCPECAASFGSAADLIEHTSTEHGSESPTVERPQSVPNAPAIRCALCGARFASPRALALHNLVPHNPGPLPRARPRYHSPV